MDRCKTKLARDPWSPFEQEEMMIDYSLSTKFKRTCYKCL
jgi:hypothetical protein